MSAAPILHDEHAATAAAPAIDIRRLTKTYGEGALAFQALKGIDLAVRRGEFLMLVGPSGSGKTTLLSILGCVLSPTDGEAFLFGEPLHGRRESELPGLRLSYIGFIFQGHNLMPALTAEENVALPMRLRGFSRRAARPRVDYPEVRVARLGGPAFTEGVDTHVIENVKVRIYSLEKTLADLFKFRNKIGPHIAVDALRTAMSERSLNMKKLWHFAKLCRVERVMKPYVDALA